MSDQSDQTSIIPPTEDWICNNGCASTNQELMAKTRLEIAHFKDLAKFAIIGAARAELRLDALKRDAIQQLGETS